MGLFIAIVLNALALLATTVVPGIAFTGNLVTLLFAGLLFGLFNAVASARWRSCSPYRS